MMESSETAFSSCCLAGAMEVSMPPSKRSRIYTLDGNVGSTDHRPKPSTSLRRTQSAPTSAAALDLANWEELSLLRSQEELLRSDGAFSPQSPRHTSAVVTPAHRRVLVDWLAEVRDELGLHSETLFLAVAYLDAFLAAQARAQAHGGAAPTAASTATSTAGQQGGGAVTSGPGPLPLGRLQLLGLTCVWVASKLHEVRPPGCDQLLGLALNAYSRRELLDMEPQVLFTLQFRLSVPTCYRFLHLLLQLAPLPPHPDSAASVRRLAEALLELSLLDTDLTAQPPSATAAAAAYLAMGMMGEAGRLGLQGLVAASGADPNLLGELVQKLAALLSEQIRLHEQRCGRSPPPLPPPAALFQRYLRWAVSAGRPLQAVRVQVPVQVQVQAHVPARCGDTGGAALPVQLAGSPAGPGLHTVIPCGVDAAAAASHAPTQQPNAAAAAASGAAVAAPPPAQSGGADTQVQVPNGTGGGIAAPPVASGSGGNRGGGDGGACGLEALSQLRVRVQPQPQQARRPGPCCRAAAPAATAAAGAAARCTAHKLDS